MTRVHRGPKALTWLINALGEPTRRRAYEAVREARAPMSRADVAQVLGIGVRLAAFHLDKLVDEGLLSAYYARQAGRRGGPGSGRPPKWYVAGANGFDITLPPRRYDVAARILLRAAAGPEGRPAGIVDAARSCGRSLAERAPGQDLESLLSGLGYEPRPVSGNCTDLLNCPFHELVEEDRNLVCSLNLALLRGATDALKGSHVVAVPEQRPGYCCVRLIPHGDPTTTDSGQG
ncbi:metalloregulator ArsR/SmtB family transcription factor [Arthrobacter sp. ISL-28]|uniref:helix-turn-helix transcriptional regulator n=1 Tax=Arthrobacter sp. ISL-28 TaxID=2819108 RepID=UPI001BEBC02C|nr:transcriptional regulator [Arthrobacter sp. ISL-28]MBT2523288.1 transcriptional regulator [Arthrobacter sp. ISL-28]